MIMLRYLKLFWMFIKINLINQTAFKLNFFIVLVTNFVFFLIQIIFFGTIYSHVGFIAGWTKYDMFFYLGTYNIIDSLFVFGPFFNLLKLPGSINNGTLDIYITKPINTQFFASLREINFGSILSVLAGVGIVVYALVNSGTTITITRIFLFIFTIFNGLLIMYSIFFILTCLAFWFIKTDFIMNIHATLCYYALKPVDIYKGVIRIILCYILPYGLMITMSAKSGIKNFTIMEYLIFLTICWGFFILSIIVWKFSLRHYQSASS